MKSSLYLLVLLPFFSIAQVQWATKVIDFSSQYDDDLYSAAQILGFPNAMNDAGLSEMAWVPRKEDSPFGEYIQVGFERAARIRQVVVAESLNPGAISKIILIFEDGNQLVVYADKNPKPLLQPLRLFRKTFEQTEKAVVEVRLVLDTKSVPGSNQIDAIGISEGTEPIDLRPEVLTAKGGSDAALPQPLGPNINSNFAERLPILAPDGKTLYFARKYHPDNLGREDQDDIWTAQLQANGDWSYARNPGAPLNNDRHNFVFATNPSGTVLYLANHYAGSAKDGISIIRKKGNGWSKPQAMPIEDFYNNNPFVSYHVSNDGQVLLMAIEREEGFGDRDLYVSFRETGDRWSRPLNLGPTINTVGIESSVFLAADNRTIYFSTSGHPGFGGLDIFRSQRLDDSWTNWSAPQNMGQSINSPQNEYNYTMPASGVYAFFTRDDQHRMSDIYRAWLPDALKPDPVALITGRLIDAETQQPIQATIAFEQLNDLPEVLESMEPSSRFQTILPLGSEVGIVAKRDGYWAVSEALDLKDGNLEELDQSEGGFTHSTTALLHESNQPEIRALQEELKTLDYELNQMATRKPLPKPVAAPYKPKEDPELSRLRRQYVELNPDAQPSTTLTEKGGQSELDRLKEKYERLNRPTERPTTVDVADPAADPTLEAMKRRYNNYHNRDGYQTQTDYALVEENPQPEPISSGTSFDELEETVILELEHQLYPQLTAELEQDLIPEIKEEVRRELPPAQRDYLDAIEPQPVIVSRPAPPVPPIEADPIRKELKTHLKDPVEQHLREQLEPMVRLGLKQEFTYQVKLKHEAALRDKLAELSTDTPNPILSTTEETPAQGGYQEIERDILMVPIKKGKVIPLNNLFFDANEATLKQASFAELKRLESFLKENPKIIVEIGGHTNGWCSHEFAKELSENRAKVVVDFLLKSGIPSSRISYHGYGKTQPIAPNNTADGRRKNQRVELKIVEILSE